MVLDLTAPPSALVVVAAGTLRESLLRTYNTNQEPGFASFPCHCNGSREGGTFRGSVHCMASGDYGMQVAATGAYDAVTVVAFHDHAGNRRSTQPSVVTNQLVAGTTLSVCSLLSTLGQRWTSYPQTEPHVLQIL